jgi:hypothetical protein
MDCNATNIRILIQLFLSERNQTMIRKMILALTAAIALTAWASAKPGTWGKENPVNENEAKAPAAMLNQWLNEFTAAYQQRDGEAMDELLKRFDDVKQNHPAAPRIEKWMASVQEAYKDQDIQKMGKLLDNAHQLRERMRERSVQNQNRRPGQNQEDLGPQGRQMRGRDGDFRGRGFGPQRGMDAVPYGQDRGRGYGRPDRVGPYAQTPGNDRAFEGRAPRFNARRPMESDMRPDGFDGGRFRGPTNDDRMGPRTQNRFQRPQAQGDMDTNRMMPPRRPYDESDRQGYSPAPFERPNFDRQRMRRPQYGPRNDDVRPDMDRRRTDNMPPDFWG